MSSSEDSDAGPKRKRKVRQLEDSPSASTSSGSPILANSSHSQRVKRKSKRYRIDSSEDSDGSPILTNSRKRMRRVSSGSESDSSSDGSDIAQTRHGRSRQLMSDSESSQWETDFSDQEDSKAPKNDTQAKTKLDSDSELSDGQSEKCPICLVSFKLQEIGTPESCDHTFCLECIQEWSKNMNTCPVDRQEYRLILVRDHLNGKVTRQIPVEHTVLSNGIELVDDLTYCEICGSGDNEDRMLLCDGCDLGFHLYCLTPPLTDVPAGYWYCNGCTYEEDLLELSDELIELEHLDFFRRRTRASSAPRTPRIMPRTRQTERIRRRVETNRYQSSASQPLRENSSNSNQVTTRENSNRSNRVTSTTTSRTRRRRRRKVKVRTVYVIDEVTGETVAVQKRMKRKSRKKSRKSVPKPKTVKTRLAQQLGMCGPRSVPQNLPDVKIPNRASTASSNISGIRYSAGIPTLDLFGHNDDLDYFTDEENYSVGSQFLTRRAPTRSDAATMRRTIRQKNVLVPEVVSSTSDLLDSILTSQEQLYARNASYSIDSTGKFKIEAKSKSNNYIDVTKEQVKGKETPYYNPNRNRYNQNQNYRPYNRYQRPGNNYYNSNNQNNYYNAEASSSMNYSNNFSNDGQDNDFPQDYSRRTLCATSEPNAEEKEEEQEESNQNDESELDIYSDIETVTTSKAEDRSSYRPLSPPPMPNISGMMEDENNDSENDMVIDDEKLQEQENQNEYGKEETTVTSTVGSNQEMEPEMDTFSPTVPTASNEIQSGAVQSSSLENISKSYQYYNDDDSDDGCPNANIYSRESTKPPQEEDPDSDDGCPNFSIYSKESKTMALYSGITLGPEISTPLDYQVGEISSSPQKQESELGSGATSEPLNSDQLYDPEQIFDEPEENGDQLSQKMDEMSVQQTNENPEESDSHLPQELSQIYDPEKDTASPIHDSSQAGDSSVLDHTYDPENCIRSEETLNTDAEKTLDLDQGYDPENIYEENSNSNEKDVDIEKAIYQFNSQNADTSGISTGDRYDPALPFDDDADADSKRDSDNDTQNEGNTTVIPNNEIVTNQPQSDKKSKSAKSKRKSKSKGNTLYSDSEDDENIVKKGANSFGVTDINEMTEDISEEERSYTPCLDEKSQKQGLEGLETELISDEDRNDFDEAQELKTVSDGDALEINAKESELDLARPEDYEEGEIVDKNKDKDVPNEEPEVESEAEKSPKEATPELKTTERKKKDASKSPAVDKGGNKENEESGKDASFKRLSKSSKGRNYRDKEKRPSDSRNRSRTPDREYNKKEKRREKRKELERYNVRAIIADKPRPLIAKDQFGRDIRNTPSRSRSRSYTPPPRSASRPVRSPSKTIRRSPSRSRRSLSKRKSPSKERSRKTRKARSYRSGSRSRSPGKKRDAQKPKKRKRSTSRFRKRKPDGRSKKRRPGSRNRRRSRTPVRRARERVDWTPMSQPHASPSWTPPRLMENPQILRNDLTVTVNNAAKKKKDKRKKDRRNRGDTLESRQRKRRHERERTPPPSKEVFASGDNILVSVSFNNENERRDVTTRDKRNNVEGAKKRKKKRTRKDLTGVKPIAIIDLAKSPFRELTPSPKQVIILTDSDNDENVMMRNGQGGICDSSQQVASPERGIGPKTPPEPQVKFSLAAKPPQIRAINNPLHDPEDIETNVQKEMGSRISPGVHKGPNTPPEPPNSPPSSPDAYDPFEPTKSRSPTPEPQLLGIKDSHESIDSRAAIDLLEKSMNPMPETIKSLTPPLADIQPADSQSSVQIITPDSNLGKSPERPQIQTVQQPSKPVAQTIPFSSVPTPIILATPSVATIPTRINILNTTVISPPVASPIPQRIVLPNIIKSGIVKISPTKPTVKTNPIKPIQKTTKSTRKRTTNGSLDDIVLDFDSPYSPGSSDYEDLFEPPSEIVTKPMIKGKTKSHASAFDALFGSPSYSKKKKYTKKANPKTKTVGVKLDEDCLKILDDLPNSAVEMQVKDKFLKKLNRQERVVDEVKLVLKPHYNKKRINKEEYKDIMRRSVPKICHNRSGEINPTKIKNLIEAYVRKVRHSKKVTSSSSVNPQKI
ncbi:PHD and RING finger domain-containing protein 1 [Diabrotica virgifera virgifera]|uniref:PHD and RING finger domain-containing protein 1 n=1 Tax=Diabrotica virgifera virgifera TaxID=50390 RepID=A0ABM5J038_DIAVI|nr:PHD and RING finger domain-containing protein 1 [Diabrotica virgifera virgifera]